MLYVYILKTYQNEFVSERKEKEKLLKAFKENKEFHLPASFYLQSEHLKPVQSSSTIGRGTFGSVELRHFKGEIVAAKLLVNEKYTFEQNRNMVLKEAKIIANLRFHNGLPSLVGICVDESPLKLVMQFYSFECGPKSLYSFLKEKFPVDIQKMHLIFLQIAEALNVIHVSGYLHNDLKLDNVVLHGDRNTIQPVIIDFNCGCKIERGRHFKLSVEEKEKYKKTRRHVAPEVVEGQSAQSVVSDIFSYGYMLEQTVRCGYSSEKFKKIIKNTVVHKNWKYRSSLTAICNDLTE
eukprot:TCONS_00008909-protein